MAVKRISLLSETNAFDSCDEHGEGEQGATYDLVRIFKIDNDDGSVQYFQQVIALGSYGYAYANEIAATFTQVIPSEKTVTVFK